MSNNLKAGFARVDITPEIGGVPLAGYGAPQRRLARRILDPLWANAFALESGDERCLFIVLDIVSCPDTLIERLREGIREATGLPGDRVFISCTHTHSAIDVRSNLPTSVHFVQQELPAKLTDAAKRAVADLKPAKLSYGKIDVGNPGFRMNFNRYYYMTEIEKKDDYKPEDRIGVGDNFGWQYQFGDLKDKYCYVGHEEEADHSMQLMRFTRDAADDIVVMHFAAHPTLTGGLNEPNLSSDFPHTTILRLEELLPGTKAVFLQGCAGNVNALTKIRDEGVAGLTFGKGALKSHRAYGAILAGYAYDALENNMVDSATDGLDFRRVIHTAELDHSMDELVPKTPEIVKIYEEEGYTRRVRLLCIEKGFNSIYHVNAARRKANEPKEGSFELNAVRIGDCAVVTNPFEMFSATGLHIKAASPFAMTFVSAYSCGAQNYLPSANSTLNSYESNQTRYVRGTAEVLEGVYQKMLEEIS